MNNLFAGGSEAQPEGINGKGFKAMKINTPEASSKDYDDIIQSRLSYYSQRPSSSSGSGSGSGSSYPYTNLLPSLRAVYPPTSTSTSTSTTSAGSDLIPAYYKALDAYDKGHYRLAASELESLQRYQPGGLAWERYALHNTWVESMLRSGRTNEAILQLSARTMMAPSDGSAWWRLAGAMSASGGHPLEQQAHLQASTMGIGQGGFKSYSPYRFPLEQ
jgi:hypothetical protein